MNAVNLSPFVKLHEELEGEREERLKNAEGAVSFGMSFLDDAMLGLFKNDLMLITARAGAGKSEIATHISLTNALQGRRVYHLALEAEKREITRRMLFKVMAREFYKSGPMYSPQKPNYLHWYAGRQEKLLEPYYAKAAEHLKAYHNLDIYYRGSEFGLKDIKSIFASIKGKADLLTLDHLHYVDAMSENENMAYKEIVKDIRDLALIYNIPVILVAHIRKADRRNPIPVPDLEDIHGTSDIFKIATKAVSIAPAKEHSVTAGTKTYRFPTYVRLAKCRLDGSLQWYCGLTTFDMSKGEYDPQYTLGNFNSAGEWQDETEKPFWAVRAK